MFCEKTYELYHASTRTLGKTNPIGTNIEINFIPKDFYLKQFLTLAVNRLNVPISITFFTQLATRIAILIIRSTDIGYPSPRLALS